MSIVTGDNFKYQGSKPNFSRDSFATLADMASFPESSIDDGHISFCKEDGNHYVYKSANPSNSVTGKWVALDSKLNKIENIVTI